MNVRLACTGVLVLLVAGAARDELRSVLISVKHDESRTATVGIRSDVKEEQREGISIDQACAVVRRMRGWGSAVNVFVISDQYLGKADLKKLASAIEDNIHTELAYLRNGLSRKWVDHLLGHLEVEVVEPSKRDDERHRAEADKNVSGVPSEPPGVDCVFVPVNTEKTLVEVVGKQFTDWTYPSDLLPDTFAGLEYVSGPGGPGVSGKGAWRKPVTLKHGPSGTEVFVDCYRRRKQPAQPLDPNLPGTPFLPLEEPDYQYQSAEFHALKAAAAGKKTRDVFVFLDGDILFKIEASGGSPEQRRQLVRSTAEAIWKFRHREDTATEGDDSSTRDSEKPRNPNGAVPGVGKAGGRPKPKITMQLPYAVSKPVPVPTATAKLFREVVAKPPARSLPESPFVAEWTAVLRCDGDAYEWSGNVIGQRVGDEWRYWDCPRLAVLFHRMMEQRANTDEKLAAALDEFERDLKQGKIPAQDKKTLQALETLGTIKRQLEQTVGGKWELQTTDEHPLAPVLVGQVEVADTGRTHLPKLTDVKITIDHKIAWSKPVGGLSGALVVPRTTITADGFFEVLLTLRNTGTEPVAVQTENCFAVDLDVKNEKGDAVPPTCTRLDIQTPPVRWAWLMPNASTCFKVGFEHKDGTQEGNLDSVTEVWKLEPAKYRLEATYKSDGFAGMTTTKPPAEPWKGELQLPAVSVSVEAPAASPEMGTGHTPKIEPDAERSVAYLTGLYAEVYLVADDKVIQLLAPLAVEKAQGPIRFEPAKDRSEAWLFEGDEVAKYVLPGGCTPLPQFPPTLPGEPDPEPLYTKQAASSAAFTLTNLPAQRSFQYGGVTEVRFDELSFSSATIKVVGRLKLKLQPLPP